MNVGNNNPGSGGGGGDHSGGRRSLLEVRGLDASYGPVQILFGLNVDIYEGEIVALLGTNGAGKSTLFKAVTGLLHPSAGTVVFDGEDITGLAANTVAEKGVVMMPGGKSVFPTLTVRENLRLACWMKRKDPAAVKEAEERVLEMFPRLTQRIDTMAGNMSGGEQQMLAVSQALMADPKMLLIDELSLGLAPTVVGQLIEVVHQVHEQGLTIVVVEQSINVALRLAERAVFMEKGEFRFSGPTKELLERPDVLRSVFIAGASAPGDAPAAPAPPPADEVELSPRLRRARRRAEARSEVVPAAPASPAEPAHALRLPPAPDAPVVLECTEVVKTFGGITAVDNVSLQLREGQILGLIGQNGAGKRPSSTACPASCRSTVAASR